MKDLKVMIGSTPAPDHLHITVTNDGPYLVYGAPPLRQQFIVTDASGDSRKYMHGAEFSTAEQPTSLCRCGHTKGSPYCDGSHRKAEWDPTLTAPNESLLTQADIIESERLTLVDNEHYCAYARFCHPKGGVWRLTEESSDPAAREEAIRQASLCPTGRLTAWANEAHEPFEFKFEPALGLLEDPSIGISSGLWVRGGILIEKENGEQFEIRNRVVLCRCGSSHNKPFCDGGHARAHWNDNLGGEPREEMEMEFKEVELAY